jgi:hypothetical protein
VIWQRTAEETLDTDIAYYELAIRGKIGDNAFSTVYFPTRQICRAPDGGTSSTDWSQPIPTRVPNLLLPSWWCPRARRVGTSSRQRRP